MNFPSSHTKMRLNVLRMIRIMEKEKVLPPTTWPASVINDKTNLIGPTGFVCSTKVDEFFEFIDLIKTAALNYSGSIIEIDWERIFE